MRGALKVPVKGATQWTVVLTTGHFGSDPQLAAATRSFADRILREIGSQNDSVVVAAAEMGIWYKSEKRSILELSDLLPTSPAKESRGGRDLEQTLVEASALGRGPVLIFSPGDSQEPRGGGKLLGGRGQISGFLPVIKKDIAIQTASGPRFIRLTATSPPSPFSGDTPRKPLPIQTPPFGLTERVAAKTTEVPSPSWLIPASIAGVVAFCLGVLVRSNFRKRKPEQGESEPQPDVELASWKSEAKQLQRKLDIVAQELAASAEQATTGGDTDKIELRQEMARREKLIQAWDETAIDYLDGLDRIVQSLDSSVDQREFATRATAQFKKLAQRAGLDQIEPNVGDLVLTGQHRVEEVVHYENIEANRVVDLLEHGYRRGDQVIRQARIVMSGGINE